MSEFIETVINEKSVDNFTKRVILTTMRRTILTCAEHGTDELVREIPDIEAAIKLLKDN